MIGALPPSFANAIAPFAPLGRQAVGQESTELKTSTFKPLEESAASGRNANQRSPENRPGEVEERERTRGDFSADKDLVGARGGQDEKEAQEELQENIKQLAARDREVRAHERAHAAVGGQYAGAPRYEYTRGPDGVNYAISGEVSIDTSPVPNNPEATIEKAQQIKRAATAPAEPSAQDRAVAAAASRIELEARAELAELVRAEASAEQEQQRARSEEFGLQQTQAPQDTGAKAERDEQQQREEQARLFAEQSARNIDINRRLIEIGVIEPPVGSGQLFNQRV